MGEHLLIGLASIIFIGIFAQWVSWYFKLPSILLLLLVGFLVGPITGLLNPDNVFGDLLFPFVSISVAIILFEGGLSLKLNDLKPILNIVIKLITVGTIVTWSLASLAAYYLMHLPIGLSLLLGAILVVTGPTVIIPLLRLVKPKGQINSILKWEGIVNDPIGAMLALLVFETIIATNAKEATLTAIIVILKTLIISCVIGFAGAYLLVYLIKKDYIPDYLQNPITLATLILVFSSANAVQSESGLFAVTLMGIYLANQKYIIVEHIIEFKENLGVLLLSALFIVLAARLQISDLSFIDFNAILFVVVLIFIIRPINIFLSTIGSHLNWKEKLYLSWMAPRGIVAAAVISIFVMELSNHGYPGANILVPIIFLVIISTILIYGLSAIPLARLLKIANLNPQGLLIVGINNISLQISKILKQHNIRVLLVDKNWEKVTSARQNGFETYFGSIVSEITTDKLSLEGIGKFIAFTPNSGINSLATIYFSKIFDSSKVFQIYTAPKYNQDVSKKLRSAFLSSLKLNYPDIEKYGNNIVVKANRITNKFSFEEYINQYDVGLIHPLFLLNKEKELMVFFEGNNPTPTDGDIIISVIYKENNSQN